ncbi:proto-oncogene tyrosine-protein kinase ROS [Rhizoctonia solani]|uniref:Proto-oncogene tyrosine-protein kinase ROS n=1 Tax=Rhizoctonia solani TaxID=456999 RepID=A0A0K6G563_9AGAM|nr:proto-oncogene tyrosine-protein kinase ROS [Rhizoctonia solani]
MCDILEGLKYMHGYPIPIPQGDLTPENISVDNRGRAKISLFSFGRMLAALPADAAITATLESVLSFRWMSPELIIANKPQPTTESDMWTFGCVCFWLLTLQEPYYFINRDDLAGVEIMQGLPPATLARVYRRDSWTTNGLWNTIARCWRQNPLQRPSAAEFMRFLIQLEGREIEWLPINVVDLAGKVRFDLSERQDHRQILKHQFIWRRFSHTPRPEILEEVHVSMALYEASYVPKWYSKSTKVVIKAGCDLELNTDSMEALYSSIQHEVTLMAQIDHTCIHKLLGIDSSPTHTYLPDILLEPLSQVTLQLLFGQNKTSYREYVKILSDIALAIAYLHEHTGGSISHGEIQPANIFILNNGRAKLAHFTCAFQYTSGLPKTSHRLSEAISVPFRPSLYCSPESQDPLAFPTLAGDVWSFGALILSSFSIQFRGMDPRSYEQHLSRGISPLDLPEISSDCDVRVFPVIQNMLAYEPSNRPLMSSVLSEISNI